MLLKVFAWYNIGTCSYGDSEYLSKLCKSSAVATTMIYGFLASDVQRNSKTMTEI